MTVILSIKYVPETIMKRIYGNSKQAQLVFIERMGIPF
jgi:hypothetical protein